MSFKGINNKLKIMIADFGSPFDLNTLSNSPLGGSEASVLLLAKGLVILGHQVMILNTANWGPIRDDSLIIYHVSMLRQAILDSKPDVVLLNRHVPHEIYDLLEHNNVYYWSHDAYDQDIVKWMMNKQAWEGESVLTCFLRIYE
jgi:hypothetical protein